MRLRGLLLLAGLVVLGLPAGASAAGSCPNEGLREAQSATFLPDCRAYEMVSPPEKNGNDIALDPWRTRSSRDGDAATYASPGAFADPLGTGFAVEYVSQRGPEGWSTHTLTPPQSVKLFHPGGPPLETFYTGELSENLNEGVLNASDPVTTGAPNVEKVTNLYLRNDILSGPPGHYQLLSNSPEPLTFEGKERKLAFAAASSDFSHILFESVNNLTANASGSEPKLYEWEDGALKLAGILPDGEPASTSTAGLGVLEQAYATNAISTDGKRVFFEAGAPAERNLYLREGGTTVQVNASERSTPDPAGPQPASFWAATPDGSKVFFTTSEELTDEDTVENSLDVYRYDLDAPVGHRLTLISQDHEPNDRPQENRARGFAVLGVSDDGSYVYFSAANELLSGQPKDPELVGLSGSGNRLLYVWHDGILRFISGIATSDEGNSIGEAFVTNNSSLKGGRASRVTKDGNVLAFSTQSRFTAGLVGYDNRPADPATARCNPASNGLCDELYVYRYDTNKLACASCDPSGARPLGQAGFTFTMPLAGEGEGSSQHLTRPLTEDGSRLFFSALDPLVPQDGNGRYDAYEYDTNTGQHHLLSTGQSGTDSYFAEASPDGHDVFVLTGQPLVGADDDSNIDLYDARIDGGIAAQNARPVAGCAGEECHPASSIPAFGIPASVGFGGAGNLVPPASKPAAKAKTKHPAKKHRKKRVKRHRPKGRGARSSHAHTTAGRSR